MSAGIGDERRAAACRLRRTFAAPCRESTWLQDGEVDRAHRVRRIGEEAGQGRRRKERRRRVFRPVTEYLTEMGEETPGGNMTAVTQTVREIAQKQPTSIRVFEKFGIEYCCGGGERLIEACAAKDVDVDVVIAALEAAARNENAGVKDWTKDSLANLTQHIVATHHAYCKEELPRLS